MRSRIPIPLAKVASLISRASSTSSARPYLDLPTVRDILTKVSVGEAVCAKGWVRTCRSQKVVTFVEISDGSCHLGLQAVIDSEKFKEQIKNVTTGAAVEVVGTLKASNGAEQSKEVLVESLKVIGDAGPNYPLQKKRHTPEFIRELGTLRFRTKTMASSMRIRSAAVSAIHDFFKVPTPLITSLDCEGGGEVFEINNREVSMRVNKHDRFFGHPAYLTVSGQLHLEAFASALSRVYTLSPAFRAEPSMTSRHLSEFWMLEAEMAFTRDLEDVLHVAEECIRGTVRKLLEQNGEDLAFLDQWVSAGLLERLRALDQPFARMSYTAAVDHLQQCPAGTWKEKVEWGEALKSEHERYLAEKIVKGPLFVTDYPVDIKPFYMRINKTSEDDQTASNQTALAEGNDNNREAISSQNTGDKNSKSNVDRRVTVACADLLVPGIGELMGGSLREERYDVLAERLKAHGLSTEDYGWYLDLRRQGSAPHGGFGIGFERLVMMLTGLENIRDVIGFPRYVAHCKF